LEKQFREKQIWERKYVSQVPILYLTFTDTFTSTSTFTTLKVAAGNNWVVGPEPNFVLLKIGMFVACEHFFEIGVAQSIGVTQRI